MRGVWAAITLGLLDMRGDIRRFGLLIVCLAVGTALIAGVSVTVAPLGSSGRRILVAARTREITRIGKYSFGCSIASNALAWNPRMTAAAIVITLR